MTREPDARSQVQKILAAKQGQVVPRPSWVTGGGSSRCIKCGRRYVFARQAPTGGGGVCPSCRKKIEEKTIIDKETQELMKWKTSRYPSRSRLPFSRP